MNELKQQAIARLLPPRMAKALTIEFMGYYKDPFTEVYQPMDVRWHDSNATDFSFYQERDYIFDGLWSYTDYSRPFVMRAHQWLKTHPAVAGYPSSILDHGGGVGLAGILAGILWPGCRVVVSNVVGYQLEFARWVVKKLDMVNVTVVVADDIEAHGPYDFVHCFDVFEHFKEPFPEIKRVIDLTRRALIENAAFAKYDLGHFSVYDMAGEQVPNGKTASRRYSQYLEHLGMVRQETGIWNSRPRVWIKRHD